MNIRYSTRKQQQQALGRYETQVRELISFSSSYYTGDDDRPGFAKSITHIKRWTTVCNIMIQCVSKKRSISSEHKTKIIDHIHNAMILNEFAEQSKAYHDIILIMLDPTLLDLRDRDDKNKKGKTKVHSLGRCEKRGDYRRYGDPAQMLSKEMKRCLLAGSGAVDIDMKNAHGVIMMHLLKSLNYRHAEQVCDDIEDLYNSGEKLLLRKAMNGGFVAPYAKARRIQRAAYWLEKNCAGMVEDGFYKGLTFFESLLQEEFERFMRDRGFRLIVHMFDGCILDRAPETEVMIAAQDHLAAWSRDKFGIEFNIEYAIKEVF